MSFHCLQHGYFVPPPGSGTAIQCPTCAMQRAPLQLGHADVSEERIRRIVREELERESSRGAGS